MVDTLHWDLPRLFDEIKIALRKAAAAHPGLDGVGVDTWGVDFGLVGRGETLLGNPVHYRDARTEGMIEAALERVPRERIYEITGLQFLPFNTVYQLLALRRAGSPLLEVAETLLMMPDLLRLAPDRPHGPASGPTPRRRSCSTRGSGPGPTSSARRWTCPAAILPELIEPGTELGPLPASVAEEVGTARLLGPGAGDARHGQRRRRRAGGRARAPRGPPTGATSARGRGRCWASRSPAPVINAETLRHNFTNEGGVAGTTRLLKNIMGLWLVQECRRTWARAGRELSYDELIARAEAARPFAALVDPDDPSFLAPGDMPARLAAFCTRTGQPSPGDEGAFVRCALESLALKYRWTIERLEAILGTTIRTIHVVGGGSRNALLCQFTADACGRPVHAGPVEATAVGNVLMQAMARGRIGSLADARAVVARSFPVTTYEPRDASAWDDAAGRFAALIRAS